MIDPFFLSSCSMHCSACRYIQKRSCTKMNHFLTIFSLLSVVCRERKGCVKEFSLFEHTLRFRGDLLTIQVRD